MKYTYVNEVFNVRFSINSPKESFSSEKIELDELIAPAIVLLNQKGYHTKYCCSGHWYQAFPEAYIYFYDDCVPNTIPQSFRWCERENEKNTIRTRYQINDIESDYDFVIRVNKELFIWAENLPYKDGYDVRGNESSSANEIRKSILNRLIEIDIDRMLEKL
jgi:hypothetical protein